MRYFKIFFGGLFVLLIASISILAILTYDLNRTNTDTWRWLNHSSEVLDQIGEIDSDFKAVQLESNAIFIRTDTAPLNRYLDARKSMMRGLENLSTLTRDNGVQNAKVQGVSISLDKLVILSDSVITNPVPFSNSSLLRRINLNDQYRIEIERQLNELRIEERRLLSQRQATNTQSQATFNSVLLATLVGVFVLMACTFILTRYHINNQMKTEVKLTNANELFFHIFDDSPIAMAITDPERGFIIDCNHQFINLVRCDREEIVGKTFVQLGFHSMGDINFSSQYRNFETELDPQTGPPVWVSSSRQRIHLKDRECILTALIDITARKQADVDIRKSLEKEIELNKLKSNFVTLASHEFRTPLTTILSSASLLENYQSAEHKEKVSRHLSRIKGAVSNLTTILDEFLSLTRIEEGMIMAKSEPVDIRSFIESIVVGIKVLAKPNQVITCSHKGATNVETDAAVLTQIITNLLSNAIKYSPDFAAINISSEANTELVIRVSDSGIGIPVEDQPYLFDRFFRASNAGNIPGTGLGLHIAMHHVELLNGTLNFVSSPGQGTTFTVTIPVGG